MRISLLCPCCFLHPHLSFQNFTFHETAQLQNQPSKKAFLLLLQLSASLLVHKTSLHVWHNGRSSSQHFFASGPFHATSKHRWNLTVYFQHTSPIDLCFSYLMDAVITETCSSYKRFSLTPLLIWSDSARHGRNFCRCFLPWNACMLKILYRTCWNWLKGLY